MYRDSFDYNAMAKIVSDIYLDYNIHSFPIDVNLVCKKMQIAIVPYSSYSPTNRDLLKKKSLSSFFVSPTASNPAMIFYNDDINEVGSWGNMRRNILHEVKHFICEDTQDNPNDDLADYFGKYFLAPIPYLIVKGIENRNDIMSTFGVDEDMANFIIKNIRNRKLKHNTKIFEYEKPLLKHLLGEYYNYYTNDN